MKTMKKVAMILLALLLVLSSMSIGVCAVGETGSINITITADKTTNLYPGDIVTFTINIKNDFNYVAMRWPVIYPSRAFEPVTVGSTDAALGNVKAYGSLASGDSTIESAVFPSDLISGSYGGVSYNKNYYAGLLIQWTGGTTSTGLAYYNEPTGSNCITFQMRVLDNFAGIGNKKDGIAPVTIPQITNVKNMFYYQGITDPADLSTLYKMTAANCPVTVTGVTTKVIKEQAALVPKNGTDVVFDTDGPTHFVYGFTEIGRGELNTLDDESLPDFITTQGDAKYTVEPNELGLYSTGAVIHAFDANNNPIDDYAIVIFGDIDGDFDIDGEDSLMVADAVINVYEWSYSDVHEDARAMACDVYGNNYIGAEDFGPVQAQAQNFGYLNQTHSADTPFYAFN